MRSNHTETNSKVLRQRAVYAAAHHEYFVYLHHLLDIAALPASDAPLPNMTTMAAMVMELRAMHPTVPRLNGVVLGRVLHRVLPPPLLTWHGGLHQCLHLPNHSLFAVETTIYRFPEVGRSRQAFENYSNRTIVWSSVVDQWQPRGQSHESDMSETVSMSSNDQSHLLFSGI